ncbi:glycoside hydrolase N-terminal domain-containing protein [Streptomyces sp. NPDC045431]|uniref:glycosyl hydrolase family 95 catalytic domain-containing protein n=1 Tax=Streptomyces sp. NPDC045431 TaxID=3155613 RepID=UPI0033CE7675
MHGTWEPAPAHRWEDAFLSGNGRHGALVFGDPDDERVVVTHHTLVRPVPPADTLPPRLAHRLPGLQDRLLSGELDAAERFTDGRALRWVGAFHPGFQVRVRREDPAAGPGGFRREVDFATGVAASVRAGRASRVFVSRADDVLVQYVTGTPLTAAVVLDPRLPGAPEDLAIGRGTVLHPRGALLTLRARYPEADGEAAFTGVTLALAAGGRTAIGRDGLRVSDAGALLLLTRVRRHRGEAPVEDEAASLRALVPEGASPAEAYAWLLARHEALHRAAYERVTLDLGGGADRALPGGELLALPDSPALVERLFAAGRYHLLSASGMLPPRLTGLWTGDWNTAWSGAFTTDANLGLQTASAAAAALPEVSEALAALVYGQWADWRDNARAIFGARGVVAPAHTDGVSGHAYHFQRSYPLHLWTAGADWLLHPLVEHAETEAGTETGAADPRLGPALAEVALFYEDFLTRTGPDGRLVIVPSYSPENRPVGGSWGALNATMDLAAARHALTAAAAHSPAEAEAARLRALADRLPDYRVNADGALAEWAWPGLEDRYDHRHLSHLYPVWPLGAINPYDTPELARAARRALELRGAENGSAHGHLHHGLVAARLRDGERAAGALGRVLHGDFFHASLMSAHYPGREVYNADAAHALPALLIELLVQSTPGRLVLLPALPAAYPRGALRGVRTRFGAEVDLVWGDGGATATVRPSRTVRVELRTPDGSPARLALTAGEERVVSFSVR